MPLLTTRSTLVPPGSLVLRVGTVEITRPRATVLEKRLEMRPRRQYASVSVVVAFETVLSPRPGTTQLLPPMNRVSVHVLL